MDKVIYFDNAATTRVSEEIFEEMQPYFKDIYFNPSSVYSAAGKSKAALDKARTQVANALGAEINEVYFTSCATESNNWALKILAFEGKKQFNGNSHIIITKIEHPAILQTARYLEKNGVEITYLDVDNEGRVDINDIGRNIKKDTVLVSVMYANNELGVIEPIEEIGLICKERNVLFHTDAVQAIGNVTIDVKKQNIDMLSLSGHKFNAPKGVGALYVRNGIHVKNFLDGGHQERSRRAGTENVACIVGLGKAAEIACNNINNKNEYVESLREKILEGIMKISKVRFNGSREHRLAGILNFSFEGIEGEGLLLSLDSHKICCSSGSACTSGSLESSHVLTAIGVPAEIAQGSLRISLSKYNTMEEVEYFLDMLTPIVERLRAMSPIWND